jgi:hypothetical protein
MQLSARRLKNCCHKPRSRSPQHHLILLKFLFGNIEDGRQAGFSIMLGTVVLGCLDSLFYAPSNPSLNNAAAGPYVQDVLDRHALK